MVRSAVHRRAPHKNWVGLTAILISIKLRTRRSGYIVVLSGALEVSPYAVFFVRLLFLYDYDAHHGRGVADRLLQHLNVWKHASPFPSWNCSDGYGGDATAFTRSRKKHRQQRM